MFALRFAPIFPALGARSYVGLPEKKDLVLHVAVEAEVLSLRNRDAAM
jgi:hypothetical protein